MPLTLDWYPDFWTKEEKENLFNFWRERYFTNTVYLSPTRDMCGGNGFFDALLFSLNNDSERSVSDVLHPVNKAYKIRTETLIQQKIISQEADRKRIQLLLVAEQKSLEYWKIKKIYSPQPKDPEYLSHFYQSYIEQYEYIYRDALAQLIEYDKEYGHPLSDPNRDIQQKPVNVFEYKRWLSRKGREILENNADDMYIKTAWKKVIKENIAPESDKNLTFIPDFLQKMHLDRVNKELSEGIKRNKSGNIVEQKSNHIYRPPMPLILSRIGDLADRIYNFKSIQDDARPNIEKVELDIINIEEYSLSNPPPLPEHNPYVSEDNEMFKGLRTEKEFAENNKEILQISEELKEIVDRIEPHLEESEDLSDSELEINNTIMEDKKQISSVVENINSEDSTKSEEGEGEGEGEERPEWISQRSFDSYEVRSGVPEFNPANMFKKGAFDREQKLSEILSKWKTEDKQKIKQKIPDMKSNDFWNVATNKVNRFKGKAVSIWKRKVAPSLGLETSERRVIAKIKNQELKHFQRMIQSMERRRKLENKRNIEQNNKKSFKPRM